MSGTSADAVDAVLVDITDRHCRSVLSHKLPLPDSLRSRITDLYHPGQNEIDRFGSLDREIAECFATAVQQLLQNAQISADGITAIGSHGQTIRHRPRPETGRAFTLQIGDPNVIAEVTGITTVADFRRRDMAVGGQGAPLVPAFHKAVFSAAERYRVILNIGGIANITLLPEQCGAVRGYDTGPGNGLMDAWIQRNLGRPFDDQGAWAASGKVDHRLLTKLLAHPYFTLPSPKSTGREEFHPNWLDQILHSHPSNKPEDIQATLLELTAISIAEHIKKETTKGEIFVCGGGARNKALLSRLQQLLPSFALDTTAALGISPDDVEAAAFAWLAMRTLQGAPGNLASVTGAAEDVILGGIYPGKNWRGLCGV